LLGNAHLQPAQMTEPFSSVRLDLGPVHPYFKTELNGSVIFFCHRCVRSESG